MFNIFENEISQLVIQALESLYIIETSKKIDIIISRYAFLLNVMEQLKQKQNNSGYYDAVLKVGPIYRKSYPNAIIQNYQLDAISNPCAFNSAEFYCNSLNNAFIDHCTVEVEKMYKLKRDEDKIKLIKALLNTADKIRNELQSNCSFAYSFQKAIDVLDKVETLFTKAN